MRFTWDPSKAASNLAKHGIGFEAMDRFDWVTALVIADVRFDYPEPRLRAMGAIGERLHLVVYTIESRSTRIISLREANRTEVRVYARQS